MNKRIVIAGAGILDVLVCPVENHVFEKGSVPVDTIKISTGGDALNEATVLARLLGKPGSVELLTLVGEDKAGSMILEHCHREGIGTELFTVDNSVQTGVNVVMVQKDGNRSFFTNPKSSLRKLAPGHFSGLFSGEGQETDGIFCLASIFVSPELGGDALAEIFGRAKQEGMIVCADMTKCKNGETTEDIREALSYVDYLFANKEEAAMVTGAVQTGEMAERFLACGVGTVVIKCGADGCFVKNRDIAGQFPALQGIRCVDTTGAGDSFAAGFLWGLSEGVTLRECICRANICGALATETVGASEGVRSRKQVREILDKYGNTMESVL